LIYANPKPHVRSLHAYFPSVVRYPDGEMVCTLRMGQAMQSHDLRTYVTRSLDNGATWTLEAPIFAGTTPFVATDHARITISDDGELIAFMIRQHREHPEDGATNPLTGGYEQQELMIARSRDRGRTWQGPHEFTPPLVGPCFEMCAPIVMLKNGTWLLSTATWQDWDGVCPNGLRTVAFVSTDRGRTWPAYVNTMVNIEDEITYWESKMLHLRDGRLLVVAWAYDRKNKKDLPNHYVISADGGKTFSQPKPMDVLGQTLTPLELSDGRMLFVYRRMDKPGLWALTSRLVGERWQHEEELGLWGVAAGSLTAHTANMSVNFSRLRFGAPCLVDMGDGTVHVSFWATEDCQSVARWIRVRV
jgi:hypothetical protein